MQKIETPVNFKDDRGEICDLLVDKNIDTITHITSVQGAVRGNHYHEKTIQYDYIISGSVECYSKAMPDGEVEMVVLKAGDLVMHPINEAHTLKALEDTAFLSITCGPRSGERYESDTIRLEQPLA